MTQPAQCHTSRLPSATFLSNGLLLLLLVELASLLVFKIPPLSSLLSLQRVIHVSSIKFGPSSTAATVLSPLRLSGRWLDSEFTVISLVLSTEALQKWQMMRQGYAETQTDALCQAGLAIS